MANTNCCNNQQYTTRSYNRDGSWNWSANYYEGMPSSYSPTVATVIWSTNGAIGGTYSNGASGVGATLTSTSYGVLNSSFSLGDSILVWREVNEAFNGIYLITALGSVSTRWVLTRRPDYDSTPNVSKGNLIQVTGSLNPGVYVMTTSGRITIGTTSLNFVKTTGSAGVLYGINTQAIDEYRVYVVGGRCVDNTGHAWSIVCFDIETGELLWDYDTKVANIRVLLDPDGNVVCMLDPGPSSYGAVNQTFIRLTNRGVPIMDNPTISFTQMYAQPFATTFSGFAIPSVGSSVNVTVGSTSGMINGMTASLSDGTNEANLSIGSVIDDSTVGLTNTGWSGNPIPGTAFGSGSMNGGYVQPTVDFVINQNGDFHVLAGADGHGVPFESFVMPPEGSTVSVTVGSTTAIAVGTQFGFAHFISEVLGTVVSIDGPTSMTVESNSSSFTIPAGTITVPLPIVLYEWLSPFGSGPRLQTIPMTENISGVNRITRIGGRDFFGGGAFSYHPLQQFFWRGAEQAAAPASSSDIDLTEPAGIYDGLTPATITPTGTTAADAAPLAVGNDYTFTGKYLSSAGLILPNASVGDRVGIYSTNPYGSFNANLYTQPGGSIYTATLPTASITGAVFVCQGDNNWLPTINCYLNSPADMAVDAAGNLYLPLLQGTYYGLSRFNPDGTPSRLELDTVLGVITDADSNTYCTSGAPAYAWEFARSSSGIWKWGHEHLGVNGTYAASSIKITNDGETLVVSGGLTTQTNDTSWLADLPNPIMVGRSATASATGPGGDYSIGFSGSVPTPGTLIIAVIADSSAVGAPYIRGGSGPVGYAFGIAGGPTWHIFNTTTVGTKTIRAFWRQVQPGEPSNYAVTYIGSFSSDSSCCSIIEIINVDPSRYLSPESASNTGTTPSNVNDFARSLAVVIAADVAATSSNFSSPPSGYTLGSRIVAGSCLTAIATQGPQPLGAVTPGPWGSPETTADTLWTILIA